MPRPASTASSSPAWPSASGWPTGSGALRPEVVLGHDPWRRYRLHPDHRHAGWLTVDGIVAARDPFFFPDQGVAPHRPDALLLFEADEPDHVEDVTGYEATKIAALLEHRSQYLSTMHISGTGAGDEVARFRSDVAAELAEQGRPAGFAYGEAFKLMADL